MGKKSRTKGHTFEREMSNELKVVWPRAKRGLSQSRFGGAEVPDIEGTPYHVECKRRAKVGGVIADALKQALRDSIALALASTPPRYRKPPLAIVRGDGDTSKVIVAMYLDDFLGLAKLAQGAQDVIDDAVLNPKEN